MLSTFATLHSYGFEVEVDEVIESPPNVFGEYGQDSVAYLPDGTLLLRSAFGLNLFVRRDGEWRRLIDHYQSAQLNEIAQKDSFGGYNEIWYTKTPGEFVYCIGLPSDINEYYRVHLDPVGKLVAEVISKEYFRANKMAGFGESLSLRDGYTVDLLDTTQTDDGKTFSPIVRNKTGQIVYEFSKEFKKGMLQGNWTMPINKERNRIAMILDFKPDSTSPYFLSSATWVRRLVTFRVCYDKPIN